MIINFTHNKGGVGKSTLAINVALNLGADILDLDSLKACVRFSNIRKDKLTVIREETEQGALNIINEYKRLGKTLIIDTGGFDSELNRVAAVSSDILITPVSPSQLEVFGLQDFISILKKTSGKLNYNFMTNVVINNADIRSKADIIKLKRFVKNNDKYLDIFTTVIYRRKDFQTAYELGVSVIELDKDSKASCEINSLCREIKNL